MITITDVHHMTGTEQELVLDADDILTEFTRIMLEWGHYKTAVGLRYPTLDEMLPWGTRTQRQDRRIWNHFVDSLPEE